MNRTSCNRSRSNSYQEKPSRRRNHIIGQNMEKSDKEAKSTKET